MAVKKWYAVRKGKVPGIYTSWDECKAQVNGFSGAEFKGYSTKSDAEAFMRGNAPRRGEPSRSDALATDSLSMGLVAYVDGSYDMKTGRYSCGCVIIPPEGTKAELSKVGTNKAAAKTRNVAGEMMGAMEAVKWAILHQYPSIAIFHDYEGVAKWVNGAWEARNPHTQEYVRFMRNAGQTIAISFRKVAAHTGVEHNERADALAKMALGITK